MWLLRKDQFAYGKPLTVFPGLSHKGLHWIWVMVRNLVQGESLQESSPLCLYERGTSLTLDDCFKRPILF